MNALLTCLAPLCWLYHLGKLQCTDHGWRLPLGTCQMLVRAGFLAGVFITFQSCKTLSPSKAPAWCVPIGGAAAFLIVLQRARESERERDRERDGFCSAARPELTEHWYCTLLLFYSGKTQKLHWSHHGTQKPSLNVWEDQFHESSLICYYSGIKQYSQKCNTFNNNQLYVL